MQRHGLPLWIGLVPCEVRWKIVAWMHPKIGWMNFQISVCDVDAKVKHSKTLSGTNALTYLAQRLAQFRISMSQKRYCLRDTNRTDDSVRANLASISGLYTHHTTITYFDAHNFCRHQASSSCSTDSVGHCCGDALRAANGVASAIDVMAENHGMDRKRGLRRGIAVVAVVPTPDGLKVSVVSQFVQNILHCALCKWHECSLSPGECCLRN
ncbi:hypothetical protein D3C76_1074890 [compost metagenome]